jgi:hypothetical protein
MATEIITTEPEVATPDLMQNYVSHMCACCWLTPDGTYSLISVYNPETKARKVVVWDNLEHSRGFIRSMSGGRLVDFDITGETANFTPFELGKPNLVKIIKDYDPYNLPEGFAVQSETHGKEWKNHISNWLAFYDCGGNFHTNDDGTVTNLAI